MKVIFFLLLTTVCYSQRPVNVFFTQFESEADVRIHFVCNSQQADVIMVDKDWGANSIRIVQTKGMADIVVKQYRHSGQGIINTYYCGRFHPNIPVSFASREIFKKLFRKN